jgi:hypothetical protein
MVKGRVVEEEVDDEEEGVLIFTKSRVTFQEPREASVSRTRDDAEHQLRADSPTPWEKRASASIQL